MSAIVPAAVVAAGAFLIAIPPSLCIALAALAAGFCVVVVATPWPRELFPRRFRDVCIITTLASVALIVGGVSRETVSMSAVHSFGAPTTQVRRLVGVLESDTMVIGDRSLLWLQVHETSTDWTTTASDATVGVLTDSSVFLVSGTHVAVDVDGVQKAESGNWYANATAPVVHAEPPTVGLRARVIQAVEARFAALGRTASPLLAALLLGRRDGMSLRTETMFREAGASHVLALSGMHLGILVAAVAFALRPIVGQTSAGIITCCFAIAYTVIVGPRPSLVRAVIMCTLVVSGWLAGRRWHLFEVLSATFLLHLLIQPLAAMEIGFVLSYLALGGIALVSPMLNRLIQAYVPAVIRLPLSAGIGAQVATLPVVLAVFGAAYPVGVVSGIVLAPLVAVFMISGAVATVVSSAVGGVVETVCSVVVERLALVIESVAWFFAGSPSVGSSRLILVATVTAVVLSAGFAVEWRRVQCPGT